MMKLLGVLSLALTTVLAAAAQSDWIIYQSLEGCYSVSFPQEPKLSIRNATNNSTGLKMQQFLATSNDGAAVFMIGYFDYTDAVTFSLEKARDSVIQSLNATLLTDEMIGLDGAQGRGLTLVLKPNKTEFIDQVRIYDTNRRVFFVQCIFPKNEAGSAIAGKCDRFADSFKVTKNLLTSYGPNITIPSNSL
jgi:hypothetical protein